MPKLPIHRLVWSAESRTYILFTPDQPPQPLVPEDEESWLAWLVAQSSFSFQGQSGHLSVLKESRQRGAGYWYAYHTIESQTHKRYLGRTETVTLARLEEVAQSLSREYSLEMKPAPLTSLREAHPTDLTRSEATSNASRQAEQRIALLKSKLSPPRLPLLLVNRARLLEEFDSVCSHRLTLLSAPAGSGKTTLLSAWAAVSSHQIAWLSLDELDNDPTRFWASVIAAIRTKVPEIGEIALAMLSSSSPPPFSTILTSLLNEVEGRGNDLILVLDDYHVIEESVLHGALIFLLDHLPSNLHLVLSSRTDPELPLSRLRVRGQMHEIRDQDLRFSGEETASFLTQRMGLPLSEEDVATLQDRTEGWIAGLQLAALSLRKRQDRGAFVKVFAGSHRFLLDYVQQEILAPLEASLRGFLLQTAVLSRLSADLCQAVTGEPESQALLESIERANLFLVPLDDERRWYRFHDLFREVLLARLQASQPELVPVLHQRAAHWYEKQGQAREAIAHALQAHDFSFAAALMEREAPHLWLNEESSILHTWIAILPDAVLCHHAHLALNTALRYLQIAHATVNASYARTLIQIEEMMARVEAGAHSQQEPVLPEEEVALIERRLRLLRLLIASKAVIMQGDKERLRRLAQEVESLIEHEEISWKTVGLYLTFLLIEFIQREGALLIPSLLSAKQQGIAVQELGDTARIMHWLAYVYVEAGRLHQGEQECLEALALVQQIGKPHSITGYIYYQLARIYYIWNRLEEALHSLQQTLRTGFDWQMGEVLIAGHDFLARLMIAMGDLEAADQALQKAEDLVQQEQNVLFISWVVATRVHYWLATGNLDQAENWAGQMEFPQERLDPNQKGVFLMYVRVFLAQQRYHQALEALECFSTQLDQSTDREHLIDFLKLHVLALHHVGKREQAARVAARLLALTEPEDHIRTYLDVGPPMKLVLKALLEMQSDALPDAIVLPRSYLARLLTAFEQDEKNNHTSLLAQGISSQPLSRPPQVASVSSELPEPLTQREQEVLYWLAQGASNQEIANAMVIQVSTVKKHISNLLTKLGAESRTQAIAQARTRSLL
jgi:LuxR family maltose regulon positive regulatory protein